MHNFSLTHTETETFTCIREATKYEKVDGCMCEVLRSLVAYYHYIGNQAKRQDDATIDERQREKV